MRIQVNGEGREVDEQCSLQDLTRILDLKAERVAIELNGEVVRRTDWQHRVLNEHDRVEIVHFVGGGCTEPSADRGPRRGSPAGVVDAPDAVCDRQ